MNRKLSLLALPYAVWLFLLVVIPILIMAVYAFTTPESAATLENFTDMGIYASVFVRSFRLAASASLICLLIGCPAAYFMAGEGPGFQRVALALIMLPMWMNFLLRTYSWMSILENNGLLNQLFQKNLHQLKTHWIRTGLHQIFQMLLKMVRMSIQPVMMRLLTMSLSLQV